jgi:hypothetical protein
MALLMSLTLFQVTAGRIKRTLRRAVAALGGSTC